MVVDGDGNLYVAHHCNSGCQDLRLSSRINGVWQIETVAGVANLYGMSTVDYDIGNTAEMAIDSQGTLHIVSQSSSKRIYLHSGTPGNWFEDRNATTECCGHWPAVAVDSNDAVHIAYHIGSNKNLKYLTNASGSWSSPKVIDGYAGWGSVMEVDSNDDIFIASNAPNNNAIKLTTVKGSGQGLTAIPMFDISPPLPDGLTMNWRTGTISGTPTEVHANTTHTVTVTALGLTTTATFTLYISGAPGSIAYADISGTHHTPITPQEPTFTNTSTSGDITSWESDPMLPTGLNIGSANGTIWGTSSVIISGGIYVIWANNSVGSSSTTVNITINAQAPGTFSYSPVDMDLTLNQAMTPNTVSPGGGAVTSWEIEPDVPTGLNFGSSNGTIWGTPTVLQTSPITYTIWANNSGGSSSTTVTITINDEVPTLSYPSSPYTIVRGYDMTDITPTVGGGTVLTWEISPSLPSGLSFTSGVISGKPFANQSTVTYTVYANNSGGSASATFDLTINEPTPNIDYNPDNYTLSNNTAIRIDPILQANPPSAVAAITYSGTAASNACLIQMGDLIFYQGTDSTHGKELWAFNHTLPVSVNNPYMVKDVYSGANDGISGDCEDMLVVNNTLFFRGNDGSNGVELWKSDGNSSGTVMVKDLNSGSGSSNPSDFTSSNDKLFFTTGLGSYQFRRWVSDGTNAGTYDVGFWTSNFNAIFYPEIEYNGSIYGQGWDGHRVLFSLNETTYERVADLGGGHNNPRALTIYDGWLYFLTYETASGTGCLYRTNGTEAGTSMFICGTPQHHPMGANGMNEFEMQVFNDELYFIRDSGSGHGDELWKTDGTQSGTVMVKDIVPGTSSGFCSNPLSSCQGGSRLYATENYLLFDVDSDGDGQLELWKTDGTSGGTSLLKEIFLPGANQIYYHQVDEIIYFRASQHGSYQDSELWSTDGTPAGTVRVEDIWEGSSGSAPRDIIDVDGTLYFIAYNGSSYSLFNVNNAGNGIIGAPTTWSISPPTLPSGLSFNNGVISGTPTTLQLTPVMYTIRK